MKTRLLPLLLLPSLASAATRSWDAGGASNIWTSAANWDAAVIAGDTLIFPAGLAAGDLAMTNDFARYRLGHSECNTSVVGLPEFLLPAQGRNVFPINILGIVGIDHAIVPVALEVIGPSTAIETQKTVILYPSDDQLRILFGAPDSMKLGDA